MTSIYLYSPHTYIDLISSTESQITTYNIRIYWLSRKGDCLMTQRKFLHSSREAVPNMISGRVMLHASELYLGISP